MIIGAIKRAIMSPYHPLQLALGLSVWSAWFVITYGGLSLACSFTAFSPLQGGIAWINLVLLLFALLVSGLLLSWAWRCWRAGRNGQAPGPSQSLIAQVSAGLHLMGAVATFAVGLMTLAVPPCV